jgi:hypothetical protein
VFLSLPSGDALFSSMLKATQPFCSTTFHLLKSQWHNFPHILLFNTIPLLLHLSFNSSGPNTGGHNRILRSTTTSNVTDPPAQDAAPAPPLDQLPVVVPLVVPPAPAAIPFELEVAKYLEQYKIYLIN